MPTCLDTRSLVEPPPLRAGSGSLDVGMVCGASTMVSARAESPLKLLVPRARGAAVWAYLATYGGGLLGGDRIAMRARIGADSCAMLGTQSSTKIYRDDTGSGSEQRLEADVGERALLAVLPDPVTCFAGARYRQRQDVRLAAGSSLVLVDALTSGREARGERWAFADYRSRNRISVADMPIAVDAVALDQDSAARMGRFSSLATVIALGPRAHATSASLTRAAASLALGRQQPLLACVSPIVGSGVEGVVLRAGSASVDALAIFLRLALGPLTVELGDDPWERRP